MQDLKLQPGNFLYYSRIDLNSEMASSGPSPAKKRWMAAEKSDEVIFIFQILKKMLFLFFAFLFFAFLFFAQEIIS